MSDRETLTRGSARDVVAIPARELAELHRRADYYRAELELAQHHEEAFEELIVERFNPRDDDSVSAYTVMQDAATFIEAQPCTCTPEMIEDYTACPRCEVLGRRGDEPVSR